jgi:two-component system chemotaxis sensor kinase CheA
VSRIEALKPKFFQEANSYVKELEAGIRSLADGAGEMELREALFRAAHSIKGGAGIFGFDRVSDFAGKLEKVLDSVRHARELETWQTEALKSGTEVLGDLLLAAETNTVLLGDYECAAASSLLNWIESMQERDEKEPSPRSPEQELETSEPIMSTWDIRFEPSEALFSFGGDPIGLLRELKAMGECTVTADVTDLREFSRLQPSKSKLRWRIRMKSSFLRSEIEKVFESFADSSHMGVTMRAVDAFGSTGAIMASTTKESSHCGMPGTQPKLAMIQNPCRAR